MLKFVLTHRQFLYKGFWISLGDICYSGLNSKFLTKLIVTVLAAALRTTVTTLCKAFAVQLQALRPIALALVG